MKLVDDRIVESYWYKTRAKLTSSGRGNVGHVLADFDILNRIHGSSLQRDDAARTLAN